MKFKVYVVTDKIPKFFLEGIKEYEKRLSRYCKIEMKKFKDEDSLEQNLSSTSHKILLSTKGDMISSEQLAEKIDKMATHGKSDVCIIIGSENIRAHETIALSSMEMDPGLTTLSIYEQIYRAYRILHNQPYHK